MTTIASSTTKPGGQSDAEERERIDREIEDLDKGESADQRDRNRDRRNNSGAPIQQEHENHEDNDDDGFFQRP